MSYSRPSFVPIDPGPDSRLGHKYKLYLFREGSMDSPNEPKGAPALFIPGHAGSYKQVRSIAAASTHYHRQNKPNGNRLDFFTVDLNEEFSAISGQLLYDQAEYLNDAIGRILSFYHQDSSVLIVGHSMGGIVARLMLTLPNYRHDTIQTVLTLATPHTEPPIVLGPKMAQVYDAIRSFDRDITLVSLAGGTSDSIVNSDAAILPPGTGLTAFSTAIPKVWTTCDHMAILWCNQLVRVVAEALVESVQSKPSTRLFESYFIGAPLVLPQLPMGQPQISRAEGIPFKSLHATPKITLLSIPDAPSVFSLLTNDLQGRIRVFLCNDSKCTKDMTRTATLLPSSMPSDTHPAYHGKAFVFIHLNPQQMQNYTTIGVWEHGDGAGTFVTAEVSNQTSSLVIKESLWTLWRGISIQLPSAMYATVEFPAIHAPLVTFRLTTDTHHSDDGFAPMIQQNIGGESKYHIGPSPSVGIHFYAASKTDSLQLHFWKKPGGVQTVHLKVDWYGSIGKCVLRYGPSIPNYMFAVALIVLVDGKFEISRVLGLALVAGVPRWHLGIFFCLGAGVLCLLWVPVLCIAHVFRRMSWGDHVKKPMVAIALALIRIIPVPVVVVAIYLHYLLSMTTDPSVVLFLSALMPYNVPELIVYIRDLVAVGWKTPTSSLASVADDVPMLVMALVLVTAGRRAFSSRYVVYGAYSVLGYYTLFGFTHPYPVHALIHRHL